MDLGAADPIAIIPLSRHGKPFATETELLVLRLLAGDPGGMYGLELVRSWESQYEKFLTFYNAT